MEAIDFASMLDKSKKRVSLETKPIKRMMLYNYLNDDVPTIIIDCRSNYKENYINEGGALRGSFPIANFPMVSSKTGSRLVLIIDEDVSEIKNTNTEEFERLRDFIKIEDKIEKGIFTIKNIDYKEFLKDYSVFIINENYDLLSKQVAETSFPLMTLDNFIYVGNFFNSKNLHQLKALKIKSIFSFLKEPDTDLHKIFPNYHFFLTDEENHAELDFLDIVDLIEYEKENSQIPILIYCFSGQSISLAVLIAYLIKSKKWSLEFATAYMMKICPHFKVPTWLYTQLQRLDFKAIRNVKKENFEITGDKGKELDNEEKTNFNNNL